MTPLQTLIRSKGKDAELEEGLLKCGHKLFALVRPHHEVEMRDKSEPQDGPFDPEQAAKKETKELHKAIIRYDEIVQLSISMNLGDIAA